LCFLISSGVKYIGEVPSLSGGNVGTQSDCNVSFDVRTKLPNYASLTADNFFFAAKGYVSGFSSFSGASVSISYNATNGTLTTTRGNYANGAKWYVSGKAYYISDPLPTS